jgi:hypothetical protein
MLHQPVRVSLNPERIRRTYSSFPRKLDLANKIDLACYLIFNHSIVQNGHQLPVQFSRDCYQRKLMQHSGSFSAAFP